jgi:hypothetical protein
MNNNQFPIAVVEAVAQAVRESWRRRDALFNDTLDWPDIDDDERVECMADAIAALEALASVVWRKIM